MSEKQSNSWVERIYRVVEGFFSDPSSSIAVQEKSKKLLDPGIVVLENNKIYKLNGYGEVSPNIEFITLHISGKVILKAGFSEDDLAVDVQSPFENETIGFDTCFGYLKIIPVEGFPVVKTSKGYFLEV